MNYNTLSKTNFLSPLKNVFFTVNFSFVFCLDAEKNYVHSQLQKP